MNSSVYFGDETLKTCFEELKESQVEDKMLYKWISRAIEDLEENAFCGIQIPKKLIPKIYVEKYKIDNLWKYDLPKGWRLIYSVANDGVCIISILLEWMDHKKYERRFNY
jgi:Txe/YoeB family toxin of Txe-Axe toxin-antitoxin module